MGLRIDCRHQQPNFAILVQFWRVQLYMRERTPHVFPRKVSSTRFADFKVVIVPVSGVVLCSSYSLMKVEEGKMFVEEKHQIQATMGLLLSRVVRKFPKPHNTRRQSSAEQLPAERRHRRCSGRHPDDSASAEGSRRWWSGRQTCAIPRRRVTGIESRI